jgi:hypothetical protein
MQPRGGDRRAIAMFSARIAKSRFIRLLTAQPMTRLGIAKLLAGSDLGNKI